MDVRERVVLITGASSGIGRELARQLAGRGARVALLARTADRLRALAAEIDPTGPRAIAVPADVADRAAVDAAVSATVSHFGRLDCLVNAAGVGYFGEVARMPMDAFDRVVKTNVYGVVNCVQAALPHLRERRGMIVNVSSGLAKRALPFLTAYAGTKSMLNGLSDGMRLELRRHRIHVLNYCAPETDTEMAAHTLHEPGVEMPPVRRGRPVGRVAARIVRAMEAERREVVEDPMFAIMGVLAPRLLDSIFYRVMVKRYARD